MAAAGFFALAVPPPLLAQAAEGGIVLPDLKLKSYETGSYLERRREFAAHIVDARNSEPPDENGNRAQGAAEVRALLEMAEFNLAYGMAAEGLSILAGLENTLLPDYAMRRTVLELALGVLDSRDRVIPERAAALLHPSHESWRDQAVLAVLFYGRTGEMERAGAYVTTAAKRLYKYSAPFVQMVLPVLLEVAVENRRWEAARRIAGHFNKDPELAASPVYTYYLARTAEDGGDLLAAFDSYRKAAAGIDLWAHRARMAIVDLGMRTGTLSRAEARELLVQASRIWTGDSYGIAALRKMAALDLETGNELSALHVFSTIINRYPGTPAAALARQQARSLWTGFYEKGARGELNLTEQLSGHRQIAANFRFEEGVDAHTEALADRFMEAGATMVAADEYRETHDFLLVARDLGLAEVDDARLDGLRLKQADALMKGGQLDELSYVLAEGVRSQDSGIVDRLNTLRARLFAERGSPEELVETSVSDPSVHYLRLRAAAYFGQQDWSGAEQVYGRILDRVGPEMAEGDTVRMLLAAHRAGDSDRALALAERFPELTRNPAWAKIARSIIEEAPALLPLREEEAQQRVDRAARALEYLREIDEVKN